MHDQLIDNGFNEKKEQGFRFRPWFVFLLLLFFLTGLFFKLQHWPGSSVLILISSGVLMGYSCSVLVLPGPKHRFVFGIFVLSLIWLVFIVYGWIARDGRPYNDKGLLVYFVALLISLIISESIKKVKKRWSE